MVPDLVSGAKLASYCLTEPGAGSDAAALRTRAVADGDYYVINGSKAFISGANRCPGAHDGTGDNGPKGVTAILVPADADGISYGKNEHKMSWNAQPTRAIAFEDVRIPKEVPPRRRGSGLFHRDGQPRWRSYQYATCSGARHKKRWKTPPPM